MHFLDQSRLQRLLEDYEGDFMDYFEMSSKVEFIGEDYLNYDNQTDITINICIDNQKYNCIAEIFYRETKTGQSRMQVGLEIDERLRKVCRTNKRKLESFIKNMMKELSAEMEKEDEMFDFEY